MNVGRNCIAEFNLVDVEERESGPRTSRQEPGFSLSSPAKVQTPPGRQGPIRSLRAIVEIIAWQRPEPDRDWGTFRGRRHPALRLRLDNGRSHCGLPPSFKPTWPCCHAVLEFRQPGRPGSFGRSSVASRRQPGPTALRHWLAPAMLFSKLIISPTNPKNSQFGTIRTRSRRLRDSSCHVEQQQFRVARGFCGERRLIDGRHRIA